MKSPMTQALMITLAIVFATALSLTIALICISYVKEEPTTAPLLADTDPLDTKVDLSYTEPTDEESTLYFPDLITTTLEETETEEQQPTGNGLFYGSNGNGTCTLIGVGECVDVCIVIPERSPSGDYVTSIAPRAFYGCSFVTAIQIPASVTSIGELAFAACNNLMYISVSRANPYYCDVDGVLYSADLSTLLTYPPMRAGAEISISAATVRIEEMAFYNCAYLTHVSYAGSAEQWERISIGTKNYSLTAAAKSFHNGKK